MRLEDLFISRETKSFIPKAVGQLSGQCACLILRRPEFLSAYPSPNLTPVYEGNQVTIKLGLFQGRHQNKNLFFSNSPYQTSPKTKTEFGTRIA